MVAITPPAVLVIGLKNVSTALGFSQKTTLALYRAGALPAVRRPSDKALIAVRAELERWAVLNMPKAELIPAERRAEIEGWPLGAGQ